MLFKAGGAAAAFSLAVSGAAYAAISAGDDEGSSSAGGSFGLIGGESDGQAKAAATPKAGAGKIASAQTSTTTVDEPQVHSTVKKETTPWTTSRDAVTLSGPTRGATTVCPRRQPRSTPASPSPDPPAA